VRVLLALAFKAMGATGAPAIPQLLRAMDDPSENVRVSAAGALGAMGPAARSAVPALTAKLQVTGEAGSVLRSAATALGDIGPDAASAIPALEQAFKSGAVGPSAQEAVLRIQGKPVPTWW
jgi:HEAT repeat protein